MLLITMAILHCTWHVPMDMRRCVCVVCVGVDVWVGVVCVGVDVWVCVWTKYSVCTLPPV